MIYFPFPNRKLALLKKGVVSIKAICSRSCIDTMHSQASLYKYLNIKESYILARQEREDCKVDQGNERSGGLFFQDRELSYMQSGS